MSAPLAHAAALPMMLIELRLPTIRTQWETVAQTANHEGWPAERFLSTVLEMEIAEREIRRHRAAPQRIAIATGEAVLGLRLRCGTQRVEGVGDGVDRI